MAGWLRATLAALLLLAAVLLPAARIDAHKARHRAELAEAPRLEASRLTPDDDPYIERVTQPYPVSSAGLLRLFLLADAVLLASWGRLRRYAGGQPGAALPRLWPAGEGRYVAALTAGGFVLRATGSNRDLWIDEITTLMRHVRSPVSEILLQATSSNNHLLNSLLGHLSVAALGEHAWTLRLPALVFGTLTIPVVYALARRYSPLRETLFATVAFTLSYHHVFFSQDARGYTGFLFGGLLGTLALLHAVERDHSRTWAVYVGSMVISVTSVMLGVVLLASQAIAVTVLRPVRRFYWMAAFCGYLVAHVYALVIPDILGFVFDDYKRPEVGWKFSGELVQVVLRGLALGPAAAAVVLAAALVAGIGVVSYWRQDRLFTSLMLLPELLMLAAILGLGVAVFPRFFLFALPVAFLLCARGTMAVLSRLPPVMADRAGYPAAVAGMIVISLFMLGTWWRYPKQDYTGARRFVEQREAAGDAVVAVGIAGEAYRYYWPEIEITNRVSELHDIEAHHRRVWLLYAFRRDMEQRRPKLLRRIEDEFVQEREFPGMVGDGQVRVWLRVRPDAQVSLADVVRAAGAGE
ncbi:MAG TPA: glycosyltransferase family 39 protein [Vicinamibacterales bacterium]|jgi:mannosyltransferase|nr:glycosyltransferase family 39 protein [Vicinamibacterales bacterium]